MNTWILSGNNVINYLRWRERNNTMDENTEETKEVGMEPTEETATPTETEVAAE